MKINLFLIFTLFVLFIYAASAQSSEDLTLGEGVEAHKGLDEIYRRFSEGYRKLDAALVAGLYTESAAYLVPGNNIQIGREKILESFKGFFDSVKTRNEKLAISFRILQRQVDKDLAYDVGIYTLASTNERGESRQGSGKFIVVAKREKDNIWHFQVDGYNNLPQAQSNQAALLDPKDLEAFLDPIFAERMKELHIPGAVISIVKDGKIIFSKGYGLSDIEKKTPVIADKTLFRIGSITKVFTATAVMQMADRGKIKLNDDVNRFLKTIKAPSNFPSPITFADLLTHTAGLDEISPGRRTDYENKVIPLGEFLKDRIVRRLPPGEIISYSTYNPALEALAVEDITGIPFKTYLRENIFEPLGMNKTSISAVKDEYKADLAQGYAYTENKYEPLKFQWFHTYPASDINSTATDMARFMIANLQNGIIDGQRILSPERTQEMHATHFRNHPKIPGWAYGFYEGEQNNMRFIEHGGSMDDGYSALLTLFPQKNLGIFIACNTEDGGYGLAGPVKTAFLNRYFPAPKKPEIPQAKNPSPDSLKEFAGKYQGIIFCHSCPAGTAYVPELSELKVADDGLLLFGDRHWKQIEPLLFVLTDGEQAGQVLLGFRQNSKGEIAYMFYDTYRVFEKVSP